MTQETASPRGGAPAVRAARRDETALLGEVLADAFSDDRFRVIRDLRALGHGPTIWRMWREPQSRA